MRLKTHWILLLACCLALSITLIAFIATWLAPGLLQPLSANNRITLCLAAVISTGLLVILIMQVRESHTRLTHDLQLAIELNQFVVHYMPVFDIDKKRCVSAEALIRWRHPHKGLIWPDQFIQVAEQSHLIQPLTRLVVEHVAKDMHAFLQQHRDFIVAINLSANQFESIDIFQASESILSKHNIYPEQIKYELTERTVLNTANQATQAILEEIRNSKSSLAVDDFGTGYSKIHLYSDLPLNYIKLDKQLLSNVTEHNRAERLISHLIETAQSLNIEVIAEGVENKAQVNYLRQHGVTHVQGWYISKALPIHEFLQFLHNNLGDQYE